MVMQSDLRDVFHGIHINGFRPVEMKDGKGDQYKGVLNDFYVQVSNVNILLVSNLNMMVKTCD